MDIAQWERVRLKKGQPLIVEGKTAIFMEYDMDSYTCMWVRFKEPELRDKSVPYGVVEIIGKIKL